MAMRVCPKGSREKIKSTTIARLKMEDVCILGNVIEILC